jgi:sialic acid synthase
LAEEKNMKKTYIIGEIGQNHNGSIDVAKLIIDLATRPIVEEMYNLKLDSIDAVKFVKRDLDEELSLSQMNKPYSNNNSFGKTYGEHRRFLELTDQEHFDLFRYVKERKIDFIETLCAIKCLDLLKLFTPDYIKIASRDLTNLPLITAVAETKIPIIVSTGMGDKFDIENALNIITKCHENISLLHCVSQYPTEPQNVNLLTITYLKKNYPKYVIGYSDHTVGIATPVAAVALGAEIIEKHITIDRRMKGTDQNGSLGPDGIMRMVRDIRFVEKWMGKEEIFIEPSTIATKIKLERSIASSRKIKCGEIITENDIHMLSPGDGIKWINRHTIVGHKVIKDIEKDELIFPKDVV